MKLKMKVLGVATGLAVGLSVFAGTEYLTRSAEITNGWYETSNPYCQGYGDLWSACMAGDMQSYSQDGEDTYYYWLGVLSAGMCPDINSEQPVGFCYDTATEAAAWWVAAQWAANEMANYALCS